MSRNEWVTRGRGPHYRNTQTPPTMMADPIGFRSRQGKQIRNPTAPASILRLPAAGSKECNDTYFIDHAATLRVRQEYGRHRCSRCNSNRPDTGADMVAGRQHADCTIAVLCSQCLQRGRSGKMNDGEILPIPRQIATRTPSSTTRSYGMRKNSVAGTAFRASTRNSQCCHHGNFGTVAGTNTSRPRK